MAWPVADSLAAQGAAARLRLAGLRASEPPVAIACSSHRKTSSSRKPDPRAARGLAPGEPGIAASSGSTRNAHALRSTPPPVRLIRPGLAWGRGDAGLVRWGYGCCARLPRAVGSWAWQARGLRSRSGSPILGPANQFHARGNSWRRPWWVL